MNARRRAGAIYLLVLAIVILLLVYGIVTGQTPWHPPKRPLPAVAR
ncbi:hypothetical protein ABT160_32975 [Streptomyces sp. NPDC001941]